MDTDLTYTYTKMTSSAGLTSCQESRQQAQKARHRQGVVAVAAYIRRTNVEPPLMMNEGSESQTTFTDPSQSLPLPCLVLSVLETSWRLVRGGGGGGCWGEGGLVEISQSWRLISSGF